MAYPAISTLPISPLELPTTPLAEIVLRSPTLKPVLDGFGLDTCCGGHLTPVQAAAEHGLSADSVVGALRQALDSEATPERRCP